MEIRTINESDLTSCAEIFSRTFSKEPWNEKWSTDSAFERLAHFYHSKGFCGVLAEEENVAGFVLGNVEPYYSGAVFYLRDMCTSTEHQSKGVGTKILMLLEEMLVLRNVRNIYLLTEYSIPAAKFYRNRGFEIDEKSSSFSKIIYS